MTIFLHVPKLPVYVTLFLSTVKATERYKEHFTKELESPQVFAKNCKNQSYMAIDQKRYTS